MLFESFPWEINSMTKVINFPMQRGICKMQIRISIGMMEVRARRECIWVSVARLGSVAKMKAIGVIVCLLLALASATNKAGNAFLRDNAKEDGVVVLKSGLQYKVIFSGDATGRHPTVTDTVRVHYAGYLVDGQEFDSSYKRGSPAEFPVDGVISGWTQALKLMKPGDHWQIFLPSHLAYGSQSVGGGVIPPHSALIFDIELLAIVDDKQ
jgi:hypothetical protein